MRGGGRGFDLFHSQSWAGVPIIRDVGPVGFVATWHGAMLDWLRNEINLIINGFRLHRAGAAAAVVERIRALAESVAAETTALHTVPHHAVNSDAAFHDVTQLYGVPPSRVHVIYNGINEGRFAPAATAADAAEVRRRFRAQYSIAENHFVVGTGGRLEPNKGGEVGARAAALFLRGVAAAAAAAGDKTMGAAFVVAGRGPMSRHYAAVAKEGLAVRLAGVLSQQALADFYRGIDVFVDPFVHHHGINTVMLEALLSGCPLVATALPSAATTVSTVPRTYGLTFPLGDAPALARQLETLRLNATLRARVGALGARRARRLFTSAVCAGAYEALMYRVAAAGGTPAEDVAQGEIVCKAAYPKMCYRLPK